MAAVTEARTSDLTCTAIGVPSVVNCSIARRSRWLCKMTAAETATSPRQSTAISAKVRKRRQRRLMPLPPV